MNEKVYIAGPVTGLDRGQVINTFKKYETYLSVLGYVAVNPVAIVPPNYSWDEAMYLCIFELLQCQKAVFLPGWHHSRGACMEMEFCIQNNIPILSRNIIKILYEKTKLIYA